ncbi:MAG: hypothetical protein ACO1PB_00380 [Ramlibacter sp.]
MKLLLVACCTAMLAGCAITPADPCHLQQPPAAAGIRSTHGMSLATFPARVPPGYTGCQRTWLGERVLATAHFAAGRVVRFAGAPPDGAPYDCRYVEGRLDAASSSNAQRCPMAAREIEDAAR